MCVVSFIGDHFHEKWKHYEHYINPYTNPPNLNPPQSQPIIINQSEITKIEFEALKKEVMEMKELLRKAKIYDEKNNEPNCEIEDKMKFLREVAKLVGIDLDDILKNKK